FWVPFATKRYKDIGSQSRRAAATGGEGPQLFEFCPSLAAFERKLKMGIGCRPLFIAALQRQLRSP
ncbi:hypothetical protein, partial [uncultured Alistipes sp.]|uniref:hypothetical protein n=1 Tax=uncultured Alistipes sp. TaxID=538949 RepID=UPI0026132E0A